MVLSDHVWETVLKMAGGRLKQASPQLSVRQHDDASGRLMKVAAEKFEDFCKKLAWLTDLLVSLHDP